MLISTRTKQALQKRFCRQKNHAENVSFLKTMFTNIREDYLLQQKEKPMSRVTKKDIRGAAQVNRERFALLETKHQRYAPLSKISDARPTKQNMRGTLHLKQIIKGTPH